VHPVRVGNVDLPVAPDKQQTAENRLGHWEAVCRLPMAGGGVLHAQRQAIAG
jgi:hypothetical protein